MSMDLKPIETEYNGYRFRSRLEARWAVFFDAVGIEYEYEKEGYDLGKVGYYLPDFWLPQVEMWAEVKPVNFTMEETEKLKNLSAKTYSLALQLVGIPDIKAYNSLIPFNVNPSEVSDYITVYNSNIAFLEFPFFINLWYHKNGTTLTHGNTPIEFAPKNLIHGVKASKSARFEHGEKPAINNHGTNKIAKWEKECFGCSLDNEFDRVMDREQKRDKLLEKEERHKRFESVEITSEDDVIKAVTEDGFQISPRAVDFILSFEHPKELLLYTLDTISEEVFIIENEHIDINGFNKLMEAV